MKPMRKVWFRSVPLVEEISSKLGNDSLVRGDTTVRKKGCVESVTRWGAIQHESGLRKVATGFPEKTAIQRLAGEEMTEVLA